MYRPVHLRRRCATAVAAGPVACGLSRLSATPAAADAVGYVRLAHLAPDCAMVDVYPSSQTGAVPTRIIPSVSYGRVSDYPLLPPDPYAVALRDIGAPLTARPELATRLTVAAGRADTVAALGKRADPGARVPADDLSMPPAGRARVRIVQAAARTPFLDEQHGGSKATTIDVVLAGGSVYSLFVIDKPTGLSADLRSDALRQGQVPTGGMRSGAGGAAHGDPGLPITCGAALAPAATLAGTRRRSTPVGPNLAAGH